MKTGIFVWNAGDGLGLMNDKFTSNGIFFKAEEMNEATESFPCIFKGHSIPIFWFATLWWNKH